MAWAQQHGALHGAPPPPPSPGCDHMQAEGDLHFGYSPVRERESWRERVGGRERERGGGRERERGVEREEKSGRASCRERE